MAQTQDPLDGIDYDDLVKPLPPKSEECDASRYFGHYAVFLRLTRDVVRIRVEFFVTGVTLNFKTDSSTGGLSAFLDSGGSIKTIAFDGFSIDLKRIEEFADRYMTTSGARTPIVIRIDDKATAGEAVLQGEIVTNVDARGRVSRSFKVLSPAADEASFYNLFVRSEGVVIHVGGFPGDREGWMLVGRNEASGREVIGNLRITTPDFVRGLKTIDRSTCVDRCFLTTACCEAYGKPDDCHELETLRAFRNGWLRFQPGGAEAIATYGVVAPKICAELARDPRRDFQLARIYWGTIVPCLALIRLGLRRPAYALYRRLVTRLMVRYAIA